MIGRDDAVLQKILPHLCIAEWGRADMETLLRDAMLSAEKGLMAISALPGAISVLHNVAADIKVYCFVDDINRISELADMKNTAVQLFLENNQLETLPDLPDMEIIPAFALKNIEHLDWTQIILSGKKLGGYGFMFIDDRGKYIHRFYNFLNLVGDSFDGAVHYCGATNDLEKLDDAYRLVEKVRPNLLSGLRLFVSWDFFRFLDIRDKSI